MSEEKVNMDLLRHELPIRLVFFGRCFFRDYFILDNDGQYKPDLSDVKKDMLWLVSIAGELPNAHLLG